MTTTEELQNMEGQTAVDVNGAKLGKIGQIYVDDQTGQPLWVTITTGMFGTKQNFAPLYGSQSQGGDLHLAV
ncbi:MAG TPA: PRC-barrel domain-containing protein, partial [Streptosporangiaceae bacterium]|nr:PRC-barrel domain-containing protein [Streptosporangiaceae bacterium]